MDSSQIIARIGKKGMLTHVLLRMFTIRQYIPKGTDFSELSDEMIAETEWKLNYMHRQSLIFRTPLDYCK